MGVSSLAYTKDALVYDKIYLGASDDMYAFGVET